MRLGTHNMVEPGTLNLPINFTHPATNLSTDQYNDQMYRYSYRFIDQSIYRSLHQSNIPIRSLTLRPTHLSLNRPIHHRPIDRFTDWFTFLLPYPTTATSTAPTRLLPSPIPPCTSPGPAPETANRAHCNHCGKIRQIG